MWRPRRERMPVVYSGLDYTRGEDVPVSKQVTLRAAT